MMCLLDNQISDCATVSAVPPNVADTVPPLDAAPTSKNNATMAAVLVALGLT
jgi:hypothetical protein